MTYDIVIATIPFMWRMPQLAPSLLKSVIEANGYKCKVVDWNIDLSNSIKDKTNWNNKGRKIKSHDWNLVKDFTSKWINELKEINPKWLGLSIFSIDRNLEFAINIAKEVRSKLPYIKIVAGGNGINELSYERISKVVDYVITDEGEYAIINLLQGKKGPGINGQKSEQINDLNVFPPADYSDLNISSYSRKEFFLYLSRGCIFNCKYCNRMVPKFRCRSGNLVAKEALNLRKQYDITSFFFADPILNGNIKELISFCNTIIKDRTKITWGGFAGIRSKDLMTNDVYLLMKQAGCTWLSFGIESASQRLRYDFGKKTTDENIEYAIECCEKNNIYPTVNLIIGHYLETEDDFNQTIDWLKKHSHLKMKIIPNLYGVLVGSYEYNNKVEIGIHNDKFGNWYYKDNTFPFRVKRWLKLKEVCLDLGYEFDIRKEYSLIGELKRY